MPQPPLDPNGFQFRVFQVEDFQGGDVALIGRAAGTEMPCDSFPVGADGFQGYKGGIPQPLVQWEPPVRSPEGECVGAGLNESRRHRASAAASFCRR